MSFPLLPTEYSIVQVKILTNKSLSNMNKLICLTPSGAIINSPISLLTFVKNESLLVYFSNLFLQVLPADGAK